jgi:phospholipid-transporting ATPase
VDKIVIEVFIYQIIMALICALFNMLLESSYKEVTQYIPSSNFWITSMTWWLLMTYFIPISLMVTMEMVKLFQGSILARDKHGYSKNYKCFTEANNTSVNENLGQIKFVFTDKTGTLTKNNMIFKHLICNG